MGDIDVIAKNVIVTGLAAGQDVRVRAKVSDTETSRVVWELVDQTIAYETQRARSEQRNHHNDVVLLCAAREALSLRIAHVRGPQARGKIISKLHDVIWLIERGEY